MFFTAVVCRSRHDIFTYSLLEYIQFFVLCRPVCTNSNKTGHTLQRFPNEANLKQQWVKFVQAKRAHFVEPFKHSVVCSSHFSSDCNKKGSMVEMGLQKKKKSFFLVLYRRFRPCQKQIRKKETNTFGRRWGFGCGRPNWETTEENFSSSKVRGQQNKHKIDLHGNLFNLLKDYR